MKQHLSLTCLIVALISGPAQAAAAADFASVKELYAAASYEEALAQLETLSGEIDPLLVNQYRALCLLGLGRTRDAEMSLQQIIAANPLYTMSQSDVSPRLVDLFKEVRKRTLPSTARQLYGVAKASYDAKDHAQAVAKFNTLLELFKDPELQRAPEAVDLKDLAEGFLTLAEAQIPRAKPEIAPAPAVAQAPVQPATPLPPRIYSLEDADVRSPIEIERIMPRWTPTSAIDQRRTFRGVLQIIIDEQGRVESASLVTPIYPGYNEDLLRAVKTWRYRPAMRQGTAVKYALALGIVLRPSGPQD